MFKPLVVGLALTAALGADAWANCSDFVQPGARIGMQRTITSGLPNCQGSGCVGFSDQFTILPMTTTERDGCRIQRGTWDAWTGEVRACADKVTVRWESAGNGPMTGELTCQGNTARGSTSYVNGQNQTFYYDTTLTRQ